MPYVLVFCWRKGMGRRDENTTMGGTKEVFPPTRWSEILGIGTPDETRRKILINELLRRYWKPVYCYLRHKGYANEPAKDLTQGFFCEIVLNHELIQRADQAKGRFRTFLLTALDHYVSSVRRKETAKKRLPTDGLIHLDDTELPGFLAEQSQANPEQVFNHVWACELLDEVLTKVQYEYNSTGRAKYWDLFREKVLNPIMEDAAAPSLAELCAKYGIEGDSKASNMIVTVKRRFRSVLMRHLGRFVRPGSKVEDEINDLLIILSTGGAR